MSGVHELAGKDNLGPLKIEQNEPVFYEDWERTIFALKLATIAAGYFKPHEVRREIEQMPPSDYLRARYYERWLFSLEKILVKKTLLTQKEVDTGKSQEQTCRTALPPVPLEVMQYVMTNPVPVDLRLDIPATFKRGDRIMTKNINSGHYTRLPRYIQGKPGVIEHDHGIFRLPDPQAHGDPGKPQHVYNVKFSLAELWDDENPSNDCIHLDLFDEYMESDG